MPFEALRRRAEEHGIVLVRTPDGLALAPTSGGQVVGTKELEQLPPQERERIEADLQELRKELRAIVRQAPRWAQEQRERVRQLDRDITRLAVSHLMEALRQKYSDTTGPRIPGNVVVAGIPGGSDIDAVIPEDGRPSGSGRAERSEARPFGAAARPR